MELLSKTKRDANLKEFQHHVNRIFELSEQLDLGDPFSYNRMREILMAIELGHTISLEYAGADAIDENGDPTEYKSTIQEKLNVTFSGNSAFPTWKEQWDYICNEKIGGYKWIYCARFEGHKIVEMWKISGEDVLRCLETKLHNSWINRNNRKDQRPGAILTEKQIKQYGTKVI